MNEKSVKGCQAELHMIEFYQPGFRFVKHLLICFAELRHVPAIWQYLIHLCFSTPQSSKHWKEWNKKNTFWIKIEHLAWGEKKRERSKLRSKTDPLFLKTSSTWVTCKNLFISVSISQKCIYLCGNDVLKTFFYY